MNVAGISPARFERADLIFHERHERRKDERRAVEHRSGVSARQGLAASGRRDHEDSPRAVQHGLDRFALPWAKVAQAEALAQHGGELVGGRGGWGQGGGASHREFLYTGPSARTPDRCFGVSVLVCYALSPMPHAITLIPGDGIGPEVTAAAQRVVQAAGVAIEWETQYAGAAVAEARGTVLPEEVLESIRRAPAWRSKDRSGRPSGRAFAR